MKFLAQFIFRAIAGAVVGFLGVYGILTLSDLDFAIEIFVISLFVLIIMLMIMSLVRFQQIKRLSNTDFTGEEEDAADSLKYKKFADYSLYTNSGFIMAILALSMSIIATKSMIYVIFSIILTIINYLFKAYMIRLMQYTYPERNIPNMSDPNFPESVLELADDGEKHVILNGLYKSYNLLNISLILAIIFATIYSLSSDNSSQIFSIIVMSGVLLVVNGKYLLVVRNK